eukprot:TRINITY_DN7067_c0_g1_i1.p1 TRINITY_DN7067_c0_g1~~TRINITY_DN7067_c0_g1_i1.p1  ORF type:complete len:126 (-),score=7.25 TRINITY_DN7067_c0_g1_i1:75-452(-)
MQIMFLMFFHLLGLIVAFPNLNDSVERTKRDVTCASLGHNTCRWSCKLRGRVSGECAWNMDTGAYNCECDKEPRGVICNIGPNTCNHTCRILGRISGECDEQFRCACSGVTNGWGNFMQGIRDRL